MKKWTQQDKQERPTSITSWENKRNRSMINVNTKNAAKTIPNASCKYTRA